MVEGSSSGLPEKTGPLALNTTGIEAWPPASHTAAQGFLWGGRRDGGEETKARRACVLGGTMKERERGNPVIIPPPVPLRTLEVLSASTCALRAPPALHKTSWAPQSWAECLVLGFSYSSPCSLIQSDRGPQGSQSPRLKLQGGHGSEVMP